MSSSAIFQVVYDGPALENHEMSTRDLAPALIALTDLIEEANAVLNENQQKVKLNVKGTFKTGCFHIDLNVITDPIKSIFSLIGKDESITGAANLLTMLGFTGGIGVSLINLIKRIKNKKIKKIVSIDDHKSLIYLEDGESFEAEKKVIKLYQNYKIHKSLEEVVKPLKKEGIESLGFKLEKEKDFQEIKKNEIEYFNAPVLEEELETENKSTRIISIINIALKPDNKWRFSDGSKTFYSEIKDQAFLTKVQERGFLFGSNDLLKVILIDKQYLNKDNEIRNEYVIEEVLEHLPGSKQIQLPFEKPEEEN